VRIIAGAGTYTPPESGEHNSWIPQFASDDLSVGTYSIPAGGLDDQTPHTEDEIYIVQSGRATVVTDSGTAPVGPGKLSFAVTNLFNQYSNNFSLENSGVPLPLNQYASAASYMPEIGKSATEQLALQPRMLFVNYALHLR